MPGLRRRVEEPEIDEAENQAFRHRVGCARRLAKSYRLIVSFEGTSLEILAGAVIVAGNSSRKSTDRRNCIFLGIKLELAESPV
jgi:hypothetical protein